MVFLKSIRSVRAESLQWVFRARMIGVVCVVPALGICVDHSEAGSPRRARMRRAAQKEISRGELITIQYPDAVDLSSFVDFVSQALEIKILYGDEVKSQTVVFRPSQIEVPRGELLELLRGMLRMRDLAMVPSDVDGWLRIVASADAQRHVKEIRKQNIADDVGQSSQVITQVVSIRSEDMGSILKYARGFLSSPKASVIEVPDKKLLIITDYESAIRKAMEIIELLDTPEVSAEIVTIPVKYQEAASVAEQVNRVLVEKATIEQTGPLPVSIQPSPTGGLLVIGPQASIDIVKPLIAQLDVPIGSMYETRTYAPQHISADRLKLLIENVLLGGTAGNTSTTLFADSAANRLYVTGPREIHEQVGQLIRGEDIDAAAEARPLRIYKPKNRLAQELIGVLSEVLPVIAVADITTARDDSSVKEQAPPGPNRPPVKPGPGQVPPTPPAQDSDAEPEEPMPMIRHIEGPDFTLTVDEHTNSLIAIGPPEFHLKLTTLLSELDRRQHQILIEVTLVAVTFNDSMSLAIELANVENYENQYRSLLFSSFGLSDIALDTGARTFRPGGGFNSIIIGPNETPFVMRAIAAHGNSRVITTPRILVSNGTSATISSVEESPFTSINASDTVATTSFAGFESAGTTLTVTPHVTQGSHIVLDYSFNFSNFTGSGSVGVPPPRTTNTFSGTVELPDAHTVIIGGLVREDESDSVTEIPILGRIPLLGAFFQTSDRIRTKSRVFAFMRPMVLRDENFADLKLISEVERKRAELTDRDYPESEYLWMR